MSGLADRPTGPRSRLDDLRRLDWRFLLPVGDEAARGIAVLLGVDSVLRDLAAEVGIARNVVSTLPEGHDTVDLVAVLGGRERPAMNELAAALRPGGVVYWEVDRRHAPGLSPRALAETLRRAELTPLRAYALRPHLNSPELLTPLSTTAPARWYAGSVYIAARPVQLLVEGAFRFAAMSQRLLAASTPFHVVVAQKPPIDQSTVASAIAPRAPAMVNHGGTRAVMVWCDHRARPTLVAKIPKLAGLEHRTIAEHAVLAEVRRALPAALADAVPEDRGVRRVAGHLVALESGQRGVSMARSSGRSMARTSTRLRDLHSAAQWITALHRDAVVGFRDWDSDTVDDVLERPLDEFDALFGTTPEERVLFEAARRRAGEISTVLPVVWEHGDYTVWNVYRRRRSEDVAVLDWEGARHGVPYVDLCRFAVHWTELASGRARRRGRRAMLGRTLFGDGSRIGQAVRATLDQYLSELSLDRRIEPILVTRLYAELAVRRHRISADAAAAPERPRAVNPALQMVGHLASYADRLFG